MKSSWKAVKHILSFFFLPMTLYSGLSQTNSADITVGVSSQWSQGALIEDLASASLLLVKEKGLFDTLKHLTNPPNPVVFEEVNFGDYLIGVEHEDYYELIPTYYGDEYEWIKADTLDLSSDTTLHINLIEITTVQDAGPGFIELVIKEKFGESERLAVDRNCFLKRRSAGGRVNQDEEEFELFAFGKTDPEGKYTFGFLPEGTYRWAVEYPGLSFLEHGIEIEIGEKRINDTEFQMEVSVTSDDISINLELVLGVDPLPDFTIYPNPAINQISFNSKYDLDERSLVHIYNSTGKIIWEGTYSNGDVSIDVSNFKQGVYLVQLIKDNSPVFSQKFIKE